MGDKANSGVESKVAENLGSPAASGPSAGGSSVRFGAIPVCPFDGVAVKFPGWCQRMKAVMRSENLWSFVERPLPGGEAGSTVIHADQLEDPLEVRENQSAGASSAKPLSEADLLRAERACAVLMCNIRSDELMTLLEDVQDGHPHQIWSRLQKYYKKTTEAGKHLLELQWATLKQGTESAGLYSGKVKALALNLRSVGVTKTQEDMMFAFINGLRIPDFKDLRSPIYRKSIKDYEDAVNDALALEAQAEHDRATLKSKAGREETAYSSEVRSRQAPRGGAGSGGSAACFKCGEVGHMKSGCKKSVACTHCKKAGHVEKNCWVKRPDLRPAHMQRAEKPAAAFDVAASSGSGAGVGVDTDEHFLMVRVEQAHSAASAPTSKDSATSWKLDSGATHHCAMSDVPVADGRTDPDIRLRVANGQYLDAPKVGSIKLKFLLDKSNAAGPGTKVSFNKVLHHQQMRSNLLSVSKICDEGYTVQFWPDKAVVTNIKTGKVLLEIPRVGGLYELEAMPIPGTAAALVADVNPKVTIDPEAAATAEANSSKATLVPESAPAVPSSEASSVAILNVHNKLAHLSLGSLQKLQASGAVAGLEGIKIPSAFDEQTQCSPCMKGKAHRQAFAKAVPDRVKATRLMGRMLSDLCGPMPATESGAQYLLLLVDEFTRMVFGFLLKHKGDAAATIIDWCRQVKNLKGNSIGEFHSDGGGEFVNDQLKEFFRVEGIKQTWTPTNTPQLNGVVERKNRTVMEACRAVMEQAGAHVSLWGHAALHVIYTQNRTLLCPGTTQVALGMWESGSEKPSIAKLMPFGCDGWVHTPDSERNSLAKESGRGKLESKAILHMFLGFSERQGGAAKMLNAHTRRIVSSRDVKFLPSQFTQSLLYVTGEGGNNGLADFCHKIEEYTWGNEMRFWEKISLEEFQAEQLRRAQSQQQPQLEHAQPQIPAVTIPVPSSVAPKDMDVAAPARKAEDLDEEDDFSEHGTVDGDADTQPDPDAPVRASDRPASAPRPSPYPQRANRHPPWRYSVVADEDVGAEGLSTIAEQPSATPDSGAMIDSDPQSRAEAMSGSEAPKWVEAEKKELASMESLKVWRVVPLPPGRRMLGVKWVYKRKVDANGVVNKHKARLVVQGCAQRKGEYGAIVAQVLHYSSLMVIIAIAAALDYEILQGDVPTAFLNAECKEEVYIRAPDGMKLPDGSALRLQKAMYGIKQAPRAWNDEFNAAIESLGYTRCTSDTCVYVKKSRNNKSIIVPIFVDDMFPACAKEDLAELRTDLQVLKDKYKIAEFAEAEVMLGMRITRNRQARTIKLDQTVLTRKLLRQYNMQQCKVASTPEAMRSSAASKAERSGDTAAAASDADDEESNWRPFYGALTGSLLYLAKSTRPDISHAVGMLSRAVSKPTHTDWIAAKRVLRYLAGTQELGLYFGTNASAAEGVSLTPSFVDADWAGDLEARKSTTGYVTKVCGSTVAWASRLQPSQALSTAEAEYIACSMAVQQLLWQRKLLTEMHFTPTAGAMLLCDNQSAIAIASDDVFHARTKHIDLRHHFIREHVACGEIVLRWVPSEENEADMLTKPLGRLAFERLRRRVLGMAL